MANYGDIGLGLMRGAQEGIQTAGSIYGLMRQKARDEREENLAPLREDLLRQQVKTGGLQASREELELKKLQEEEAFDAQPYDPKQAPGLAHMTESEQETFLNLTSGVKTFGDMKRIKSQAGVGETLMSIAVATEGRKLQSSLQRAYQAYQADPTPENKATVDQLGQQIAVGKGEYDKLQTKAAINTLANDPNLKATFDKYPELGIDLKLAQTTGDPKALQSLLQKITELRASETTAKALEAGRSERSKAEIEAANKRAAAANVSRERAAAVRASRAPNLSLSERNRVEIDALLKQYGQKPTTIEEWMAMQGRMQNALPAWGYSFRGGWKPPASGATGKLYESYLK